MNHSFSFERENMVTRQIQKRGLIDAKLLQVFKEIPRHLFVPADLQHRAYEDCPLPIGCHQTISQPYIVALMTSLLELNGEENVLEIGTGSGYQAAVLSRLVRSVHTIERHPELARQAEETLRMLDIDNVNFHLGDGSRGWEPASPYDAILVTAAAPTPPQPLFQQIADGGRLVIPVGERYPGQDLQRWKRYDENFIKETIIPVAFVPLRGEFGWDEDDWQ